MRIGELARLTGVSPRSLRYYEEQGLLKPARLPGGYREYDDADVETVRRIRLLLAAQVGTATIARFLDCVRRVDDRVAPVCPDAAARLERERERLDRAIAELERSRGLLDPELQQPA